MADDSEVMWMDSSGDEEQADTNAELPDSSAEGVQRERDLHAETSAQLQEAQAQLAETRKQLAASKVQLKKEASRRATIEKQLKQSVERTASQTGAPVASPIAADTKALQQLKESEATILQLQKDVQALREAAVEAQERQQRSNKRILELEHAVDVATETVNDEQARRLTLETAADGEFDELQQLLQSKQREIDQLRKELQSAIPKQDESGSSETQRTRSLREELSASVEHSNERASQLEAAAARLQAELDGVRSDAAAREGRLLEELGAARSSALRLQAEFDTYRQVADASLHAKSDEVARLMKELSGKKVEVQAAAMAAKHAREHATAVSSIWNLPTVLRNSTGVRQLTWQWLEENPQVLAEAGLGGPAGAGSGATPGGYLLGAVVAGAVVLAVFVFLAVPRYLI